MIKLKSLKLLDKKLSKLFANSAVLILASAFILRVFLSFFGTLDLDFNTFLAWSRNLNEVGFKNFYVGWSDYLPGYLYILSILGKLKLASELRPFFYKLPAIFADLGTGWIIYQIVYSIKKNKKLALVFMVLYLFNPAVIYNSTLWGQVDAIPSFFGLLSLYILNLSPLLSAVSLAVGTAVKPQTALASGAIFFMFVKDKWSMRKMALYTLTSFLVFCALFIPFLNQDLSFMNLYKFIAERITVTLQQYPYTSVNAFNFWGLFGFWKEDVGKIPPLVFGYLILVVSYIYSFINLRKLKNSEYIVLAVLYLSGFLFFTRMHERHLLASFAPILISSSLWGDIFLFYLLLSLTYIANLYYSFVWIAKDYTNVFSRGIVDFFILVNILSFLYLVARHVWRGFEKFNVVKILEKKNWLIKNFLKRDSTESFPKVSLTPKVLKIFLILILVFSFFTRVLYLSNPRSEYFDEVYHAFTARLVLHEDPKAWEWWNPNPEGFAYEWTHPPVAKLAMALGMLIFGENSFGWRIPGVVLGAICVYLVYKISREIFKDELLGVLSALVYSLDGLVLVMSRIGMNDTYFLFFSLLSIFLFLRKKDFLSASSLGFAIASKWSGIWVIPILFAIFLVVRKKFVPSLVWFFILPPTIYIGSYFQMFLTGHGFDIFVGVQKQMWWYHTNLKATHPYTSSWWSWPFDLRPVYLYTSDEVGGWVARIYNLGNPLVFWFGLFSIAMSAIYAFYEKNKRLALIVFSYLIFFVPWAASPRIMFFYHYLPSIPFLAISLGYFLRRNPKTALFFILPIAVVFVYFYPHWVGIKIPLWLDSSYYWFASWR